MSLTKGTVYDKLNKRGSEYDKYYNPISVYLNNEQITFDQPPIIQNGRIMIPIRAVTEKMGADVYYNEGIKTAFVKYGKKGVIIPAYSYDFPIAGAGEKYSQWGKYTADVASTIENGRMLVPIRALCESMGCEVTWNENERTAYITYDDSPKESMTNDEFGDINALYYASSTNYNPFSGYTDALMEYYASRNKGIDAAAYTYANYTTALSDLINTKASGRTNAELWSDII